MTTNRTTGSSAPTPKIAAAGIGGAIATILVWVVGLLGLEVPAEVAAAFATVISFAAGYLKGDSTIA
ncbi:MAG: hypothetical protein M3Q49_11630 [Actinomycetota bacterium]|nr:hypothetical protein [Actinomycetota bacterium]MDP9486409.1 hypothetical protein [Actinomycetota bacterium]